MQLRLSTPLAPADQSNLRAHLIPFVKHAKYYPNSFVAELMENKKLTLLMTPPQIFIELVYCWTLCFMTFADSNRYCKWASYIDRQHLFIRFSRTINYQPFLLEDISKERERFILWIDLIWLKWLAKIESIFSFTPSVTSSVSLQFIVNF